MGVPVRYAFRADEQDAGRRVKTTFAGGPIAASEVCARWVQLPIRGRGCWDDEIRASANPNARETGLVRTEAVCLH